jgi:branched-chain amino acid transport system substrate-binding protein
MAISFKGYAGIGFAAAIGLAASASLPTYAQEKGSIKIGLMLPYKGVYGPLAENIDRGFHTATRHLAGQSRSFAPMMN